MSVVTYVSPSAPFFTMNVPIGEKLKKNIKFINKELHLDSKKDAKLISVLDDMIETTPNISQVISKVDPEEAAALARAHRQQMARMRGTVQGPITSADTAQQTRARMAERDANLVRDGADPSDVAAMHEEIDKGLELTEDSSDKVEPEDRDGFVPNEQPAAPVAEPDPKKVFANLGNKE